MTLLLVALAYLLGLAAARWWWGTAFTPLPSLVWLLPLLLLPLAAALDRRQEMRPLPPMRWPPEAGFEPPGRGIRFGLLAAVALCFVAGVLRYGGQPLHPHRTAADLAYYNLPASQAFDRQAPQVTVTGYVDSYPLRVDGRQEFYLAAQAILPPLAPSGVATPVQGRARVTSYSAPSLRYGQAVAVSGRLSEPGVFDGFSYADYLAAKGIGSVIYQAGVQSLPAEAGGSVLLRWLYAVRAQGEALLARRLAEPYAALAAGMLLGIRAGIPDDLYDQFNITGASHVIVISGSNVALVSGVIVAVAARLLGRRRALWPALAAIACFALLVGGEAAVLRAALMGGLLVLATTLGRRSTALVSLAAACLLITLLDPPTLWDAGLQLSCAATAGLVLFVPPLLRGMERLAGRWQAPWRTAGAEVLAVTLAASLATLPLVLYYFGRLSLVSLLANLLIAPVQPLILLSGNAALLIGLVGLEPLAGVLLWLPWLGLAWTVAAVRWCAGLPLAAVDIGGFGLPHVLLAYAALGAVRWPRLLLGLFARRQPTSASGVQTSSPAPVQFARLIVSPAALLAAAVLAALIWAAALAQPDGRLHVWFLNVGQGDGILIQTPSGRQVLVDGGASATALLGELGAVMPFWDRDLDLLVLTHPDVDHMAAQVEAASRFTAGAAWETPASALDASSAPWQAALAASGVQIQRQSAGGWADLGDGVALWVLGPPAPGLAGDDASNQNSLVARLVYGDFSVLLTGDAGEAAEAQLLRAGAPLQSTVLKVAHHGSKFSTSAPFVQAVNPTLAVIQVGADNKYGHPADETLERLAGSTILRTDEDGRIEIASDGRQVWVETEQ